MKERDNKGIHLERCPFCRGNTAYTLSTYSDEYYFVSCHKCGACGSLKASEKGAVAAWNRHSKAWFEYKKGNNK